MSELVRNSEILVVEDDPALLHVLRAALDYGGFSSDAAGSASEAWRMLASREFAAIVLDLGLPDVDGFHLIRQIRAASAVPILVVSGLTAESDRIKALDCGADDFISKPFLPGELLARVRAALRRHFRQEGDGEGGAVALNRFAAAQGPDLSSLSGLESKLYDLLAARRDQIVSEEEIVRDVWGDELERGSNHVRLLVLSLRRKLDEQGAMLSIVNHRGRGYRLTGRI